MTLDFTKPITTRDGRAVRILCTDWNYYGGCPVLGLVSVNFGIEVLESWTIEGKRQRSHTENGDLINPPAKRRGWIHIYKVDGVFITSSDIMDIQERSNDPRCVATVQLPEWECPE